MALAIESIGQLIMGVGLFGTGMALAITSLVLAISRSITKNADHWALAFGVFSWTIALITPNMAYAGLVFGFGTLGIILSYMPIAEKMRDTNIYVLAIVFALMNFTLLIGVGAYATSINWQTNYATAETQIYNIIGTQITGLDEGLPDYKLCRPNQQEADGTPCKNDVISGTFNANLFVPFASILTMGIYIGKAVAFMGMTALAPIIITTIISNKAFFVNQIIVLLVGFIATLWQMAIFYKLVLFILDRRGAK